MRYAIIGAGLAGLTAAVEIRRLEPQAQVDVFEATERIGGKLFTVAFESGPTDLGAEGFLYRRKDVVEFFESLGLGDKVRHPSGLKSLLYSGGEAKSLPAGGVMGIPSSSKNLKHLVSEETTHRIDTEGDQDPIEWTVGQDINVGKLVRERYGDEVVDRVVSALLGGVYSCSADDLGMRATVPQLAKAFDALKESDEKVTLSAAVKKCEAMRPAPKPDAKPVPVFGAFEGGYATLYEALAEEAKADIYLDAFISGIEREGEKFKVVGGGEPAQEPYDKVLVATPAPTTKLLLKKIAPEAAEPLNEIKMADSVVIGMKFDSAEGLPDNSGVLIAADEPGVHTKAFTLVSKKWPHVGERGGALVRASFGRFGESVALHTDEDTLVDWALDDLQKVTGFDGRAAGLSEIYTQRWFGGLPRYGETHLGSVDKHNKALASVDNVETAGAWHGGVGVPAVVTDARAAAARLVG